MENASPHAEITILSAEDLRVNGKLLKKKTFVRVKTDPYNSFSTKIDSEGGSYPAWHEKLVMDLPMHARFITIEVHCKTSRDGSRLVGIVNVPVSDILGGGLFMPENYMHFLSYRLRDKYGDRNGIINLSIRLNSKVSRDVSSSTKNVYNYACSSSQVGSRFGVGVPVGHQGSCSGVVTGIPVWST